MDARGRSLEREAETEPGDASARARVYTEQLRAGDLEPAEVTVRALLGDDAAALAMGRAPSSWAGPDVPAAEELGNGLAPEACLRASLAVLRLTREAWGVIHTPGTPAWAAHHFAKLTVTDTVEGKWDGPPPRRHEDGRRYHVLRMKGTLKPVDGQEPVRVGSQSVYAEDGALTDAQRRDAGQRALHECHRAIHRFAKLPDVGGILRLVSWIEARVEHRLRGFDRAPPAWPIQSELRALGDGPRFFWAVGALRVDEANRHLPLAEIQTHGIRDEVNEGYRMPDGRFIRDEEIYAALPHEAVRAQLPSTTTRGRAFRAQVRSAAGFVAGGAATLARFLRPVVGVE